ALPESRGAAGGGVRRGRPADEEGTRRVRRRDRRRLPGRRRPAPPSARGAPRPGLLHVRRPAGRGTGGGRTWESLVGQPAPGAPAGRTAAPAEGGGGAGTRRGVTGVRDQGRSGRRREVRRVPGGSA